MLVHVTSIYEGDQFRFLGLTPKAGRQIHHLMPEQVAAAPLLTVRLIAMDGMVSVGVLLPSGEASTLSVPYERVLLLVKEHIWSQVDNNE